MQRIRGTWGNDDLTTTAGGIFAYDGNDTLRAIAQPGRVQIHTYAAQGNDWTDLDFASINGVFSHGHHVRGDSDGITDFGRDVFHFRNTQNVANGAVVVGRIEDFDPSRDRILLEGRELNFRALPSNVRVVEYAGAHNDPGRDMQQWLLIETARGGIIFYTLEGARVDMDGDGGANNGDQEHHFLLEYQLPDFRKLKTVTYIDPENYIPAGFQPRDGIVYQDDDNYAFDVNYTIEGSAGGDLIAAGLNDDLVYAQSGADVIWGGSGADSLYGQEGADSIKGGSGNDFINGGNGNDTLKGGRGDDVIQGASLARGDDTNGARDRILGNSGNDTLSGGLGNDWMSGGAGDDFVYAFGGNDRLIGRGGDDYLDAGNGDDRLYGSAGADSLFGGAGNDYLSGGVGHDSLTGAQGDDTLFGNRGRDTLEGDDGKDFLSGATGADVLYGGAGNDTLYGNHGHDVLDGGAGDDVLYGGVSGDVFVFNSSYGADTIHDFDPGQDIIKLQSDLWFRSYRVEDIVDNFASIQNGQVVLQFSFADTLTLANVATLNGLEDHFSII